MKGINVAKRFSAHRDECSFASFSSNNDLLLTGSDTAKLWTFGDSESEELKEQHNFTDHTGFVNHGEFSRDGTKIVTCSNDKTAILYSLDTGQILRRLERHNFGVSWCTFSLDSSLLCSCSWDNTAVLSSADTGSVLSVLLGHKNPVTSASFSSDGNLATSSWDKTIRIWNLSRGTSCPMTGHVDVVWSVHYCPTNPNVLASVSRDLTTCLWDTRMAGRVVTLSDVATNMKCIRFSHDAAKLVTVGSDSTVIMRQPSKLNQKMRQTGGHRGTINHVSFTSNSQYMATAGEDGTVNIWNTSLVNNDVEDLSNLLSYSDMMGRQESAGGMTF